MSLPTQIWPSTPGGTGLPPVTPQRATGFVAEGVPVIDMGVYLGWLAPELITPQTRLQSTAVWEILVFLVNGLITDCGRIVREGTPDRLKADLRERLGLDHEPTLDDVFLDATGRTRSRVAGDVQEVS